MELPTYELMCSSRLVISEAKPFCKVVQIIYNNDNERKRLDIRCMKNNIRTEKGVVLSASEFKNIINNFKSQSYLIFSNENNTLKRVHYMNYGSMGSQISTIRNYKMKKQRILHSIYLTESETQLILIKSDEIMQCLNSMP